MKRVIVYFLILSSVWLSLKAQSIVINELMSSNARSYYNENHHTPDWIELYNDSNQPINLKGFRISDKDDYENAWVLPDTVIQPNSFCVLIADGLDTVVQDSWVIEAAGWGLYQNNFIDSYRFDYLEVNGDFEISVEISSVTPIDKQSPHIGLILTEDIKSMSNFVALHYINMHYSNWYWYTWRDKPNTYPEYRFPNFKNRNKTGYLRMKRIGDTVYTYCEDSYGYINESHANYFPNKNAYTGIAAASTNDNIVNKFYFRNLKFNGSNFNPADLNVKTVSTSHQGAKYRPIEMHTNFKISDLGETIFLWNDKGVLLDSVAVPALPVDVSYARIPDGGKSFKYSKFGTADRENSKGTNYETITPEPVFSIDGGWYNSPLKITIESPAKGVVIHYTTNGAEPDTNSTPYKGQLIHVPHNMVIKAFAIMENGYQSKTHSRTFFIKDSSSLPVVSISTNMNYLTNNHGTGMFDKIFSDIRTDVHFEFFDLDKNRVCDSELEMRIFGHGVARGNEQPSLRLDSRNHLDNKELDYSFFGSSGLKKYETIRLRNSSGDWAVSFCRDVLAATISKQIPSQLAASYQPVLSFINGQFFGMYNLREHTNESFLSEKYNIPEDSVNVLRNFSEVTGGSPNQFFRFLDQLYTTDSQSQEFIGLVNNNLDIINLSDYTILSLYLSNFDWPFNNMTQWSSNSLDGKWRYICNDFDWSFAIDNYVTHIENDCVQRFFNNKDSAGYHYSKMTSRILENEYFRNIFLNRTHDLLNSIFLVNNIKHLIDSTFSIIEKEVPRQKALREGCMKYREANYPSMIEYAENRPWRFFEDFIEIFELSGVSYLTLTSNNQSVKFRINSLYSDSSYYSMLYFHDVPIEVELIGGSEEDFLGWNKQEFGRNRKIIVTLTESIELEAQFANNTELIPLVINEIMYRPADDKDCKDWFELYNPNKDVVSLTGYTFKDENDDNIFIFPDNTKIEGYAHLVVSENPEEYRKYYRGACDVLGPFEFGIGKSDQIRLYDVFGNIVDSVAYTNDIPWPSGSDRTSRTIELISPDRDNNIGANWQSSYIDMGTPCMMNSIPIGVELDKDRLESNDITIYPNPAANDINLQFNSDSDGFCYISIFDARGDEKLNYSDIAVSKGENIINIETDRLFTGFYIIQVKRAEKIQTSSLRIIK